MVIGFQWNSYGIDVFFCRDLMMCSYMAIRQFNHNGNMNDDI